MSCKYSSIYCISTAQIRWNTKWLFNSNTGIFNRSWVETNKLFLEKNELTLLFKERIFLLFVIQLRVKTLHRQVKKRISGIFQPKIIKYPNSNKDSSANSDHVALEPDFLNHVKNTKVHTSYPYHSGNQKNCTKSKILKT